MAPKRNKIKESGKKVRVTMTLETSVVIRLDRIAKSTKQSRSAVVGRILSDAVGDAEVFVKALSDPVLRDFMSHLFTDRAMLKHMAKAVGEEVTDDQMRLFTEKMSAVLK